MSIHDAWFAAQWPFVAEALPRSPARVLEIGCGPEGGFVPRLLDQGHDAVGVDPEAPDGPVYHRVEFEQYDVGAPVDAVVACTSLHHVDDLAEVLDKVAASLTPGGVMTVVEWDWRRFDEPTARWCFTRLPQPSDDSEHAWLVHHQADWVASGRPWADYMAGWAEQEGLHTGDVMVDALDLRFDRLALDRTPYFFADLDHTSPADEQVAIDTGDVQATGIHYIGRVRKHPGLAG